MTPDAMKGYTEKMGVEERYCFERPVGAPVCHVVSGYGEVKGMLEETGRFRPPYADRVGAVVKGQGCVLLPTLISFLNADRMEQLLHRIRPNRHGTGGPESRAGRAGAPRRVTCARGEAGGGRGALFVGEGFVLFEWEDGEDGGCGACVEDDPDTLGGG